MLAQSDKIKRDSFFSNLLQRAKNAAFRWEEMVRMSSQEIDCMARDLRVSTPELLSLAAESPGSAALLDRRLALSGLSKDVLAVRFGDVLRDLERVCTLCAAKQRCAADLDCSDHAEQLPEYCPNELTLRALVHESADASAQYRFH